MYPVCSTGVYCPLTDGCELQCITGFGTLALNSTINHTCDIAESFCSYEESCKSNVETPGSFSGIKWKRLLRNTVFVGQYKGLKQRYSNNFDPTQESYNLEN